MSSSIAIATVAVANSTAAGASARKAALGAKRAECKAEMTTFTDSGSSVAAKRQYAACVELVHPTPSSPPTPHEKAFVGGITVFLAISVVIGAWTTHRSCGGTEGVVLGAIVGAAGGIFVLGLLAVLVKLAQYLAS